MARTLPPPSDAPSSPRPAKARRESAGTARAGAARGRTGLHPETAGAGPNKSKAVGRTAERQRPRASRGFRTEVDRELVLRMLEALRAGTDVRARKVRRLKAAIKVRAYENDLKFQVALERMKSEA